MTLNPFRQTSTQGSVGYQWRQLYKQDIPYLERYGHVLGDYEPRWTEDSRQPVGPVSCKVRSITAVGGVQTHGMI